jgi:F-type H+-transporting ATPase subunit b
VEISWSTFVLEIINFLVLVWILKHFLYKPVLDVIARRRAGIEKTVTDAEALRSSAETLQAQYEGRIADWEQERQQARDALAEELEAERAKKMAELQTALQQEQEKMRVAEARRQADSSRKIEESALLLGSRFATRLLQQASGPDVEARLVELVCNELAELPADRIKSITSNIGQIPGYVTVFSAFPLADEQRQGLSRALARIIPTETPVHFEQDSNLLAGVRIMVGAWVLGVNLQDELKGFMEVSHGN